MRFDVLDERFHIAELGTQFVASVYGALLD
jgi:hypothetical protein